MIDPTMDVTTLKTQAAIANWRRLGGLNFGGHDRRKRFLGPTMWVYLAIRVMRDGR